MNIKLYICEIKVLGSDQEFQLTLVPMELSYPRSTATKPFLQCCCCCRCRFSLSISSSNPSFTSWLVAGIFSAWRYAKLNKDHSALCFPIYSTIIAVASSLAFGQFNSTLMPYFVKYLVGYTNLNLITRCSRWNETQFGIQLRHRQGKKSSLVKPALEKLSGKNVKCAKHEQLC